MSAALFALVFAITAGLMDFLAVFGPWTVIDGVQLPGGLPLLWTEVAVATLILLTLLLTGLGLYTSGPRVLPRSMDWCGRASWLLQFWWAFVWLVGSAIPALLVGILGYRISEATTSSTTKPPPDMAALLTFLAGLTAAAITFLSNLAPRYGRDWLTRKWVQRHYGTRFGELAAAPNAHRAVFNDSTVLPDGPVSNWGRRDTTVRLKAIYGAVHASHPASLRLALVVDAGEPVHLQVAALDWSGQRVGYADPVDLSADDPRASVTPGAGELYEVKLGTVGLRHLVVVDRARHWLRGTYQLDVRPGPAKRFYIQPSLAVATAGAPTQVTVSALDVYDNVATRYTGAVELRVDGIAQAYTFQLSDAGVHVFDLSISSAGQHSMDVIDTSDPTLNGAGRITITAGPPMLISITAPPTASAGSLFRVDVGVLDHWRNPVDDFTGTLVVTSSDPNDRLNPRHTFVVQDRGKYAFGVVLAAPGAKTLRVADEANPSLAATFTITVG